MSEFYNSAIKNRFMDENNLNEIAKNGWKNIFSKTKSQEETLQKDIYQMNKEECEALLHFFNMRSVQYIHMRITNLKQYIYWCDSQGLVPHHINYFEGLGGREIVKSFIGNQVMENQILSKEKIAQYTKELVEVEDYQGAVILNLLFLGVMLSQQDYKCELCNIKISDIDFENKEINTNKRVLNIDNYLIELIREAIEQESMINLLDTSEVAPIRQKALMFNNGEFLINSKKTSKNMGDPTSYIYITKRIREIGAYVGNPHINASYLNLSGIIDYVKNNYKENQYNDRKMYEELVNLYKLEITPDSLKQKLLQFLI